MHDLSLTRVDKQRQFPRFLETLSRTDNDDRRCWAMVGDGGHLNAICPIIMQRSSYQNLRFQIGETKLDDHHDELDEFICL